MEATFTPAILDEGAGTLRQTGYAGRAPANPNMKKIPIVAHIAAIACLAAGARAFAADAVRVADLADYSLE